MSDLLYVFDFDDTLAVSEGRVKVTSLRGDSSVKELSSAEFASHEWDPTQNQYDFSSFHTSDEIVRPIHKTLSVVHSIYATHGPEAIVVLTARDEALTPEKFLERHCLFGVSVCAIGLKNSKAEWLRERLKVGDINKIVFYENSEKHITEVIKLRAEFRGKATIDVWRVKQRS